MINIGFPCVEYDVITPSQTCCSDAKRVLGLFIYGNTP